MILQRYLVCACVLVLSACELVNLNGGYLSINGAVTATQIDFEIRYQASVQWLAMIFSPDQVSADVHIFSVVSDPANPVSVIDAHLDQNSYIQKDDVSNIQPSITGNPSNTLNGIYVAYNRDLNTGDSQDRRLYADEIITVCFISSTTAFQGNGYEKNMPKVCSYISLHKNAVYSQDRMLGNYAATGTFNGNNLTVYATQGTQYYSMEPWLYMTVVNSQQGLSSFTAKWIGIGYGNNMTNLDITLIQGPGDVTVRDMYSQGHSLPVDDISYTSNQGNNDLIKVMGGFSTSSYFVCSFKRKFSTGDNNRDTILTGTNETLCFVYGGSLVMNSSGHLGKLCVNLTIKTLYQTTFRNTNANTNGSNGVIYYKKPNSTVKVVSSNSVQNLKLHSILLIALIFLTTLS